MSLTIVKDSEKSAPLELVGGKANGLLALKTLEPEIAERYLNANNSLQHAFYSSSNKESRAPIETNEIVRVVSDGERGFVFNISRH